MKCFYHPAYDAVGLCKNCGKGLCSGCAVDLGDGLACKERCEEAVEQNIIMVRRARTAYQKTDKIKRLNSLVILLMGLAIVGFGLYANFAPIWVMGLLFCALSLVSALVRYAD